MTNDQLWQAVLGELELTISKANFTTWFRDTFISGYDGDTDVVVGVPNVFTKSWLEKKYTKLIAKAFAHITLNKVRKVCFKIETKESADKKTEEKGERRREEEAGRKQEAAEWKKTDVAGSREDHIHNHTLNEKYTFCRFVVGSGNELAHAASMAVAESPGVRYNPLFLYGGVGLGKTHLIQAIGNHIKVKSDHASILYVNFEKFTNDYVRAAKHGTFQEFREFYRSVDVLLVDDVQFMLNKEKTQDEFFHTFEALHQRNSQIVITSDRPPKMLSELQDRLISRFEWGMIADVSIPDLETRLAILKSKCEGRKEIRLNDEILYYLAGQVKNNIRELEGALNKIIAWNQLHREELTLEITKKILSNVFANPSQGAINSRQVIKVVSEYYEIHIDDLVGASRKRELVLPRQVIMYILREELGSSYPLIGNDIGGRDHTTAMHACKKIERQMHEDDRLRQQIESIKQRLYT